MRTKYMSEKELRYWATRAFNSDRRKDARAELAQRKADTLAGKKHGASIKRRRQSNVFRVGDFRF